MQYVCILVFTLPIRQTVHYGAKILIKLDLYFSANDMLKSLSKFFPSQFYKKENMKDVKFTKNITENEIRKENFIHSFLSSIRQKMISKRK